MECEREGVGVADRIYMPALPSTTKKKGERRTMKIKDIAGVCRKEKEIIIYDRTDGKSVQQYVGVGAAVYKINGLPYLTSYDVATMFDLSEEQKNSWYIEQRELPASLDFDDFSDNEIPAERLNISIIYGDKTLRAVATKTGIFFVNALFLRPFKGISDAELYLRERGSNVYLVVKTGFLLNAMIMPIHIIPGMLNSIRTLADKADVRFIRNTDSEKMDGQMEI